MQLLVTGGGNVIGTDRAQRLVPGGTACRRRPLHDGHWRNPLPVVDDVDLVEGDLQVYERVDVAVCGCEGVVPGTMPSFPRSVSTLTNMAWPVGSVRRL